MVVIEAFLGKTLHAKLLKRSDILRREGFERSARLGEAADHYFPELIIYLRVYLFGAD
jgi:hypothetical protein